MKNGIEEESNEKLNEAKEGGKALKMRISKKKWDDGKTRRRRTATKQNLKNVYINWSWRTKKVLTNEHKWHFLKSLAWMAYQ